MQPKMGSTARIGSRAKEVSRCQFLSRGSAAASAPVPARVRALVSGVGQASSGGVSMQSSGLLPRADTLQDAAFFHTAMSFQAEGTHDWPSHSVARSLTTA